MEKRCLLLLVLALLQACTAAPTSREWLAERQLSESVMQSGPFQLWVVTNGSHNRGERDHLLILIEGDGSPWIRNRWVAQDPTPLEPMLLRVLPSLPVSAAYLGRPCYFPEQIERLTRASPQACNASWWTSHRYGENVVASLAGAIRRLGAGYREVTLLGYSGGGALAVLAARHVGASRLNVMTWAGNLDSEAWSVHHRFSPLTGSLNPAQQASLPASIRQIHIAGAKDTNIQAQWVEAYSRRQPAAEYRLEPHFDHRCCWLEESGRLLNSLLGVRE